MELRFAKNVRVCLLWHDVLSNYVSLLRVQCVCVCNVCVCGVHKGVCMSRKWTVLCLCHTVW